MQFHAGLGAGAGTRQSAPAHRPVRAIWSSPATPVGYLLASYRIATAPEPNSSRLTSFKSTRFDNHANNVERAGLRGTLRPSSR
jgi:hypothetical protein